MTAINRLTNKSKPSGPDNIPIWDSSSGRTRNITVQSMSDFSGNSINPIVNAERSGDNIVFTKFSGETITVSIV